MTNFQKYGISRIKNTLIEFNECSVRVEERIINELEDKKILYRMLQRDKEMKSMRD